MDSQLTHFDAVLDLVRDERLRQIEKWGHPQYHDLPFWAVILGEEYGEACKAIYEATTKLNRVGYESLVGGSAELRDVLAELVQVATVAVAALEDLIEHDDRCAWDWRNR